MPISVEKLTDMPVILCTLDENYNPAVDIPAMASEAVPILESQPGHQFLVFDTTRASMGWDDLISGASVARQQLQLLKHPQVIENLIISENRLVDLAAKGMNSPASGNIVFKPFPSLAAAFSYVIINSRKSQGS